MSCNKETNYALALSYHRVCSGPGLSPLLLWGFLRGRARPPPSLHLGNPHCSPDDRIKVWNNSLHNQMYMLAVRLYAYCKLDTVEFNTFRIWSPTRRPSSSAGLPSWTLAMKMPTSFPPASRSPTLSPFWKFTITVFGLYKRTACHWFSRCVW